MATSNSEYVSYADETTRVGTLSRSTWLAQPPLEPSKVKEHKTPSPFNLVLALMACLVCPLLGWLSIIFAVQAQIEFGHKNYNEAAALCTRARGTAIYSIAIGVCLSLAYGILVGAGLSLEWYD